MSPTNNSDAVPRLGKLAVTIAAVVFGIAATELLFRMIIFPDWTAVAWATFVRHPIYETFQKPNLSERRYNPPNYDVVNRTNSLGFRDREQGFEDDLNSLWIAGGSNTFAAFVEDDETYAARLQALGFPNANLGSEGHTFAQQTFVMRHMAALGYRPRAVLSEISLYNHVSDYRDAMGNFERPLPDQTTITSIDSQIKATSLLTTRVVDVWKKSNLSLQSFKGRLLNHSAAYCWLKVGINKIPYLRELTLKLGLRSDTDLTLGGAVGLLDTAPENPFDQRIKSTVDYVAKLRDWVTDNLHVPFAIVLIPSRFQLDNGRFRKYVIHHGLEGRKLDPSRPYRLVLAALRRHGIIVFDAEAVLRHQTGSLGFPDDGHMNAVSHDVLARGLAKWIPNALDIRPAP